RKRLSEAETILMCVSICDAMEHAHKLGIVHRDLKPGNIMCTKDGSLKVLDFGVAKLQTGKEFQGLTTMGMAIGSPEYMSPEQARGEDNVDLRSDVYALGCLIYRMLSGSVPFSEESTLETMARHMNDPVPLLSEHCNEEFSGEFDRIIQSAMAKDREKRYSSMKELKSDLLACCEEIGLSHDSMLASTAGVYVEPRPRWLIPVITVGIVCFIAAAGLAIHSSKDAQKQLAEATKKPKEPVHEHFLPISSRKNRFALEKKKNNEYSWVLNDPTNTKDEDLKALKGKHPYSLYLSGSGITGTGLRYLSHWSVERVDMGMCAVSHEGIESAARMKSLHTLNIDHSDTVDLIDMPHFPTLYAINVNGCPNVKDNSIKQLVESCPGITRLKIGSTGVSALCLKYLKSLKLISLEIYNLPLKDEDIRLLSSHNIASLDISTIPTLTDKCLDTIAKMKTLQNLRIDGCSKITESGIKKLKKRLPNCKVEHEDKRISSRQETAIDVADFLK
ncbi:MAG: protein kinase, partial [Cyanobacteria bacterium]|nr:protein kinase [Cyanobacteriota bacterium]